MFKEFEKNRLEGTLFVLSDTMTHPGYLNLRIPGGQNGQIGVTGICHMNI